MSEEEPPKKKKFTVKDEETAPASIKFKLDETLDATGHKVDSCDVFP